MYNYTCITRTLENIATIEITGLQMYQTKNENFLSMQKDTA